MSFEVAMQDFESLKLLLKKTLSSLREKELQSDEEVIVYFITLYEAALYSLDNGASDEEIERLCVKLLGKVRQYLEHSSDYGQDFIYSMSDVEKMVEAMW